MSPKRWQAHQFNIDHVQSLDNTTGIHVCLTTRERQLLMIVAEHIGSTHRYYSDVGTTVDLDTVQNWRDTIINKLMGVCSVNCAEVWACILPEGESVPDDLLAWLIDKLGTDGDVIETIQGGNAVQSPVATEIMFSGCDFDQTFAFCLQLVQFVNAAIEDGFEILEAITNVFDFARTVAVEISFLLGMVEYLQDTFAEQYLASYTTTLENEYACDLFCMAIDPDNTSCTLTWEQGYEYFLERFGAGLANKNIFDLVQFVVGGGWSGTEFCDAAFALFFGTMYYSGEWWDITLAKIQKFWASWLNDSNSDWATLCDCVEDWYAEFDFTQGQLGWTIDIGSYSSGLITALYLESGHYAQRIYAYLNTTTNADIRKVAVTVSDYSGGSWVIPVTNWALAGFGGFSTPIATRAELQAGGDGRYTQDKNYDNVIGSGFRIDARASDDTQSNPGGFLRITKVEIWGSGTAPTEVQNNATDFQTL